MKRTLPDKAINYAPSAPDAAKLRRLRTVAGLLSMTYYADLTPYSYSCKERNTVNVGWLSKNYEYSKGEVRQEFLDKLELLLRNTVNLTRGSHECELCYLADHRTDETHASANIVGQSPTGNGEIRVKGAGKNVYAAPTLILHYVKVHGYKPPSEFIEAVLKTNEA